MEDTVDDQEFDALFAEAQEVEGAILTIVDKLDPDLSGFVCHGAAMSMLMRAHLMGWGEEELVTDLRDMLKVAREA